MTVYLARKQQRAGAGRAAEAPTPAKPTRRHRPAADYIPFPPHLLPGCLADLVRESAVAIGCDEANVALPVLAAVAAAVGNTRQIRLKRGWTEPAVVWAALVGAEQEFRDQFKAAMARYVELDPDQQQQEERPALRRVLTEDITIESIGTILQENPRGIINARDEIDDWFQGMTRYKGKQGGTDRGRWLKLSNADTLTIDRKTGEVHLRRLFVLVASCSLTGTIQPGILCASLDQMARASGLAARLLLAWPTARRTYWSEAEVDPVTEDGYRDLIRALLTLTMTADGKGRPAPHVLNLTAAAKALWVPFFDAIQDEKADAEPDIAAVLAKLEGYAARFALIHHVVSEVEAGRDALSPVGEESVRAGIALSRWFAAEARRIYAMLAESDEDREHRELVEWVRSRGGRTTARDLQHSRGGSYPTSDAARGALHSLVDAGLGTWVIAPNPRGGHPRETFVLDPRNDNDTCDTRLSGGPDRPGDRSDTRSDTRRANPEKSREFPPSVASVVVVPGAEAGPPPDASQATDDPSVGASVGAVPDEEGAL